MSNFKPYALYLQSEFYDILMEKDDPNSDFKTRLRRLKRKRAYILHAMRKQIEAMNYHNDYLFYEEFNVPNDDYIKEFTNISDMLMSNYWDIERGKDHLDNAFSEAMDDICSPLRIDVASATIEALAQEKPVRKVKEPAILELLNKHKHEEK